MSILANMAAGIRHVNQKYAKPEIQTTLFVKVCLLSLRLYLLGMVGLMIYALATSVAAGK